MPSETIFAVISQVAEGFRVHIWKLELVCVSC